MVQLNESRISSWSGSTDFGPHDTSEKEKSDFDIHKARVNSQTSESTQKQANLSHIDGTTPQGKLVPSPSAYNLTPDQRAALDYMTKVRALTPDVKEVKRALLPTSVKFSGEVSNFEDFKDAVEGHYLQQQVDYLFDKDFVEQYTLFGPDCYINFDGVSSANQAKKDAAALYGALQLSCKRGNVKSILLRYKDTRNGVAAWKDMIDTFENDRDQEARISKLEVTLNTHFSKQYKEDLTQ